MVLSGSKNGSLILIVDDDEFTRDSCLQVLSKAGYQVVTASDGNSGLSEVKRSCPDLVLIDLNMPGISGLEVIDLLNKVDPGIPKVVITGNTTIDLDEEIMNKRGASGYLRKSFVPNELKSIVEKTLGVSRVVE
jgi:DNA-binding NtrC family response regulator